MGVRVIVPMAINTKGQMYQQSARVIAQFKRCLGLALVDWSEQESQLYNGL